jgi:glycosyltransferase involved in cell wall biosynthesis
MILPRRVLHVIDSLDLGGAQTFLLDLVKNHNHARYLPEVAVMHGKGVYCEAFEKEGVKIHSLSPGKFPPLYVPNFWRLMRREKFDILHFHLFGANLCAKPLALAAGHTAIIVHDQCNDASRERNPMLLTADAVANRGVARVIAVSQSVRRYLLDREDLPDDSVEMIPNGIDTELFVPPSEEQRVTARLALGLPPDVQVIGGVGRLVSQKNFPVFLEVAAQILARNPTAIFVIAGTGPLETELKMKAVALGIGGAVRFLGHVSHRPGLYQALDALLLTSDFEGTPLTLLESMATAIPVVASAVDGIAEVCTDGHDAILVTPRDVAGFANALARLQADRVLNKQLGDNARVTMINRYEIRFVARRVELIYDKVLGEERNT